MKKSQTLQQMIHERKGYRTENYSGSLVRNIYDIIRYEISMGNTDIITYLQKEYNILNEYNLEEEQIEGLKSKYPNEKEYKQAYFEDFSYMCIENSSFITEDIERFILQKTNVKSIDELEGLWLTTYENVVSIYNNGSKGNIEKYLIPSDFLVISDLDMDGSLFILKITL